MDGSDTSDFESADEFFSDSEEVPHKSDIQVEIKPKESKKDIVKGENKGTEIPDFQKPEHCWEPGMDYDVEHDSSTKHDATVLKVEKLVDLDGKKDSEDNTLNIRPLPSGIVSQDPKLNPIRTSCWFPELNEANIKREQGNVFPGPPKFDRDGNPMVYKEDKSKVLDAQKNSQESTSEMHIPRIRTTCWVPALNEANRKRRENEKHPPKPPTVDRDGNPIIYKENRSKELENKQDLDNIEAKNDDKDLPLDETASQTQDLTENSKETKDKIVQSSENQELTSEMEIPRIRTSCWVPALNEANRQRRENEKHPPKPPTIDRDGNLIIEKPEEKKLSEEDNLWETDETWEDHDEVEAEKMKLKALTSKNKKTMETDQNLWDNNDQWEVEELPDLSNTRKTSENEAENLWKDDMGSWGDEETMTNPETTSKRMEVKQPESSDDSMWENDQWESVENESGPTKPLGNALENLTQQNQSWGNWGNWVISSVSQGLTTVIGVPDPEELARRHLSEKQQTDEELKDLTEEFSLEKGSSESGESFVGIGNLVSGVTKLVETTGSKVISGGLGTLETIGKKTMEVLQENDPGLMKKRAFLKPERPVLSMVLKEAKEKAEKGTEFVNEGNKKQRKVDYEIMFDDYQGLVHIEALSMLSRQCSIKLSTILSHLSGAALTDLQETLDQVRDLCELPEESSTDQTTSATEFREATELAITELCVPISFAALAKAWEELELGDEGVGEVYREGVASLARFTAMAVEQLHRTGELLLVKDSRRSTVDEADSLVQICSMVIQMLNTVTTSFTDKLNGLSTEETKEEVNQFITNIFFESSNSIQYIRQAFQLLIPVLQVGAT